MRLHPDTRGKRYMSTTQNHHAGDQSTPAPARQPGTQPPPVPEAHQQYNTNQAEEAMHCPKAAHAEKRPAHKCSGATGKATWPSEMLFYHRRWSCGTVNSAFPSHPARATPNEPAGTTVAAKMLLPGTQEPARYLPSSLQSTHSENCFVICPQSQTLESTPTLYSYSTPTSDLGERWWTI